jgi:hypothetical protein
MLTVFNQTVPMSELQFCHQKFFKAFLEFLMQCSECEVKLNAHVLFNHYKIMNCAYCVQ